MKKFVCVLLSLLMVFSMSPLAFATDIAGESNSAISPVDYQYVAAEIAAAQDETVIQQMSEDIHYYWSTNSFVVQDGSGYYLVEFDKNNDLFYVNGKPFRITISTTSNAIPKSGNSSGFPTPWVTVIDSKSSFDVGGLPASVVGGIVGGALGGGSGAVAGAVICAVAGMLIDGVFPIDYNLTVTHLKRRRALSYGPEGFTCEYFEKIGVYGGPSNNLYSTTLYANSRTYTEVVSRFPNL